MYTPPEYPVWKEAYTMNEQDRAPKERIAAAMFASESYDNGLPPGTPLVKSICVWLEPE
jgi:hypothetical protein